MKNPNISKIKSTTTMRKLILQAVPEGYPIAFHLRLVKVNGQTTGISGFVQNTETGATCYLSSDIGVYLTNEKGGHRVLYREAKDLKDYTGGRNLYAKNSELGAAVYRLLEGNPEAPSLD